MNRQNPATIMCIDRDEVAIEILEWQFRKAGFTGELVMCTEMTEALEYLLTNGLPDVLITDFFLNKFDHFHSLHIIQQMVVTGNHHLKLVIAGEFLSDKSEIPAEVSYADFVLKPIDVKKMEEWI